MVFGGVTTEQLTGTHTEHQGVGWSQPLSVAELHKLPGSYSWNPGLAVNSENGGACALVLEGLLGLLK